MSSPYPNLSPEGERLFDPPAVAEKDAEIEYLRKELVQWNDLKVALGAKDSTAFFDALCNRDKEIARLKNLLSDDFQFSKLLGEAKQRMAELTAMLEEAMKIFALYLNVPESRALQERWNKLKNQP